MKNYVIILSCDFTDGGWFGEPNLHDQMEGDSANPTSWGLWAPTWILVRRSQRSWTGRLVD